MISNELKIKYKEKYYFPKAIIRDSDGVRYLLQMWNGNHVEVKEKEVEIVKLGLNEYRTSYVGADKGISLDNNLMLITRYGLKLLRGYKY